MRNFKMLLILLFLVSYMRGSTSLHSLGMSECIRDGGETLLSADASFELGFFSPGTSTNRYLGVWYTDVSGKQTVVWVANRETPLHNKSGILMLNEMGILQLRTGANATILWSSKVSDEAFKLSNSTAELFDSGNLVVKSGQDEDSFLWQSFDYPCDTLMPGMKLGLKSGIDRYLSSWKSTDDPAVGEYSIKIDRKGYPQLVQMKGSFINAREGSWNGIYFTGYPNLQQSIFKREFVFNDTEVYYEFDILDRSIFKIFRATPSGGWENMVWTSQTAETTTSGGQDACDSYAFCGSNSVCNIGDNVASCECLKGYVPKFPQQWNVSYWSNGCVRKTRKTSSACNNTQGFLRYKDMKLPDTSSSWFNKAMNLEECQKSCLKNCSCTAYANLDIRNGGTGCLLWFDHLIDIRQFSQEGQDLYIKVPSSELANDHGNKKIKTVAIAVGVIIFGLICWVIIMLIKYPVLAKATDNFSSNKKLGEGGFGPVYKATINGQELAVKRLPKKSGQGSEEFKNEVVLIAKLQHRNLVKLLGCCIQGEEKILVYEYMPNKSLDHFVFDETRRKTVDWLKRFNIIGGIARGLLYLHQDSRLKIIHRDLKTSNILLDANLNPKISDFGLARTFFGDQVEANTNRVAGTYGYMPPEYAVHGQFSEKSDVFSYGVIVLELLSAKRNREFSDSENYLNLLGHAWRLWTEDRPLELLDEVIRENCNHCEAIRCIQVGLLCVQQRPEDRPSMSLVVLMLNGEKMLPKPNFPGFYIDRGVQLQADSSLPNNTFFSANQISITILEAR
ncbi:G-type lectin S-receptor-like serine/threonine-protein kinase At4g27290 isoform X2 [Arachis duranensis]|uniref:Receptor-like serine/threonine-protein kinase n=1 Tax=Arachis duranensis TaxID=130453 RepID=A0A9C6TDT4_ARADU|nr:G-type lectin S-receptor-like serine/threonine-protein kinase At4g27290 isoform X2 [Arachis duranensis]